MTDDGYDYEMVISMVVNRGGKWYVRNKDNTKDLGGPYDTRDEAIKRLQQIEFFKHQGQ